MKLLITFMLLDFAEKYVSPPYKGVFCDVSPPAGTHVPGSQDPRVPGLSWHHIAPKLPQLARARHDATLKDLPGRGAAAATAGRAAAAAAWCTRHSGTVSGCLRVVCTRHLMAPHLSHSGSVAGNLAVSSAMLRSVCKLALSDVAWSDVAWRRGALCRLLRCSRVGGLSVFGVQLGVLAGRLRGCEGRGACARVGWCI